MSKDSKQTETENDTKFADAVAKAVGKAIEEAVPVAVMAANKVAAIGNATGFRGVPGKVDHGPRCTVCGQFEVACKNRHVMMIVAPKNPRRFKSFPGIFVNGIQYISPDMHTPIPVPAENNFSHQIRLWEESEEDLYVSRSVSHNSGVLSGRPGSSHTMTPYAGAGFRG